MRINVTDLATFSQPVIGNVYDVSGGHGRKVGYAMVLLAITEKQSALLLVIDKKGNSVGVTSYGLHAIKERTPIAFVPGLEDLTFDTQRFRKEYRNATSDRPSLNR